MPETIGTLRRCTLELNEFATALGYIDEAILVDETINHEFNLSKDYFLKALAYEKKLELNKALRFFKSSSEILYNLEKEYEYRNPILTKVLLRIDDISKRIAK